MRYLVLFSTCYLIVQKSATRKLLKIVIHWKYTKLKCEKRTYLHLHPHDNFSLRDPLHHVHKSLWNLVKTFHGMFIGLRKRCPIRNSNVKYWKRFLDPEILSLETGGMGIGGGRSGSRQRGAWNPGPLPSSHGQERLFQRLSGNQGCSLLQWWISFRIQD